MHSETGDVGGVVGINLPTFVERRCALSRALCRPRVSSGLTSRPSLSEHNERRPQIDRQGVVGINLPTFVERPSAREADRTTTRVVGINLPTFVERRST